MLYFLFKFIHIAAAIAWIGSVFTLSMLHLLFIRKKNLEGLVLLGRQSEFFGKAVIGPSAGITLIAGITLTALLYGATQPPFWVIWGFLAMLVSGTIGGSFIRRTGQKLEELALSADPGDSNLQAVQQRLMTLSSINLLVLLSAVWVMVFKPTL